jgi:hypothetical protein
MPTWIALVAMLLAAPPLGATLTSVRSTGEPLWFSNPALGLKGTIKPIPGARFEVVVITVGDVAFDADLRHFALTTEGGAQHEPIAAGGGPDLIFPIDSMPLGREIGQILPDDSLVTLKRTSPASVMLEADPHATLAFVFQVPAGAVSRVLKLPDGTELTLAR